MGRSSAVWDRRVEQDRAEFAALLAPLIVASATTLFEEDRAKPQLHVWMLSLEDVPKAVLREAIDALIHQGITWMPKPGDVRRRCAEIVAARRRELAPRAAEIVAKCEQCGGSGFEQVDVDGVASVRTCSCRVRALALFDDLPEPIALPPAPEEVAAS